ncbi:twin-arginine translocase TatA/TatE family subunit [Bartonella tribocorum]|uniref:Sec-independent protein translocase protein TatA n=1 Tax=Bartonella tribocorum (strain DSM 28219 / CCUG 45778 / CIP 105476 / IBS 506) TaxID=382640 RepID=TATA_BART1|nr:twin-arginine translocase TatA/TatE family subunit [Bartonella tribocorum]A9IS13.1 RecName: Full=Sec-independent protein translocase protein TatA [Bartonella tribocorum CIP 105476]CAK01248.1 sec-independent protein translocase [Bartonella tribocorum CIP 105476]CDO48467.1 twin-arginine translocation protein TatA [Bartonella tribocorum]
MGNIFSPTHLIIILLLILLLFGRGRVAELMGDVAKGIKAFKKNMKEEEESIEDKVEMADTSQVINEESQQSQPLSVKRAAIRRKASSDSKGGKASIAKKQRVK